MKKLSLILFMILFTVACSTSTAAPTTNDEPVSDSIETAQMTESAPTEEMSEKVIEEAIDEVVEEPIEKATEEVAEKATAEPIEQPTEEATKEATKEATEEGTPERDITDLLAECLICEVDLSDYDGPLSAKEVEGLLLALNDEYHAWVVYDQVISDFGQVRPFINIRRAEARHIDALLPLFETYGVPVPENLWLGNAPSFDSRSDACAAGVEGEILNAALYDYLFASTEREEIITVYESLQRASDENHLPAFQRCARSRS